MKALKGLLGVGVGLFGVLVFCGSVSGVAVKGREWIYSLNGSLFILPPLVMSICWFIAMTILVLFFTIHFIEGFTLRKTLLFLLLGALHTACALSLFLLRLPVLSLIFNLGISILFILLFLGVKRAYPKFFVLFLVYFLWISYLFAINWILVVLN